MQKCISKIVGSIILKNIIKKKNNNNNHNVGACGYYFSVVSYFNDYEFY